MWHSHIPDVAFPHPWCCIPTSLMSPPHIPDVTFPLLWIASPHPWYVAHFYNQLQFNFISPCIHNLLFITSLKKPDREASLNLGIVYPHPWCHIFTSLMLQPQMPNNSRPHVLDVVSSHPCLRDWHLHHIFSQGHYVYKCAYMHIWLTVESCLFNKYCIVKISSSNQQIN